VIVDVGGGYGGSVTLRLTDNDIQPTPFNGANLSLEKTKDGQLHALKALPVYLRQCVSFYLIHSDERPRSSEL
jgi:hypothetical protein